MSPNKETDRRRSQAPDRVFLTYIGALFNVPADQRRRVLEQLASAEDIEKRLACVAS